MCEHELEHDHAHCRELLSSLSEYVDGELKPDLCTELERHLSSCQRCRIVVDTLKKTVALYQDCTDDQPLPADVRSRLFVKLDLQDFRKEENR